MDNDIIGNAKILIVDDQPANLSVLFDYLDDFNARIFVAQSGQRALKFMENETFDIIILDIVMPEMDGFEVCETLKTDDNTKDIYIIVLTSINREKEKEIAFKSGADDYLTKPFRPLDILKKMEEFFSEI